MSLVLMEKLEDGRMIFNNEGVRDYLTEFMCDAANEATTVDHKCPIMLMLTNAIGDRRDDMICNMVDALFDRNGEPIIEALTIVYRDIFGMKLEEKDGFIYGVPVDKE